MKKIILFLMMIGVSNQLFGQSFYFKRYQYDEFVYGITVPKLKNIKEIADYYKITENEIYKLNQRFENANLAYEEGQLVYLPAGTLLNNTNVAFENLKAEFKNFPTYKIDSFLEYPFIDNLLQTTISKDTMCQYGCIVPVATIDLGENYWGFIYHNESPPYSETTIHTYFHNDFLREIHIGGIWGGDSGHTITNAIFRDYDNDGIAEIVVKTMNDYYYYWEENYYHKFDKYRNYEIRFQGVTYDYELFKVVDGNYLNVSMDFILKD